MSEPTRPDPWVGRATPRPVDPWGQDPPPYVEPPPPPVYAPPGYILVQQRPPRPRRRGMGWFLAVAGIFAACCAGGATLALLTSAAFSPDAPTNVTQTQAADPAPTTADAPTRAGLNTPVRDGKFEFVVTAVTCGHDRVGIPPITKKAKGQFCVVELTVQNISTKDQLLLDGVQRAFGPDGAEYGPDTGAGLIANAGLSVWVNNLNPGGTVAGKIVYDVPKGVQLARLELHDSAFSAGTTITL